jgi:RimJ/RimL family protein N-acetyltransferase
MRTGRDFREEHVLKTGERVVLRHIQPSDADALHRAFDQLSPESKYRRFFASMGSLDTKMMKYLTEVDGIDHVAIVALGESLDLKTERGLGVARFVRLPKAKDTAEIAVVVVDDMQKKGLGALLLSTAVVAAKERGITHFRGEVLAENRPVMTLLEEVGAKRVAAEGEGTVAFEIELAESENVLQRMLRVAATQVAMFIRRLTPPDH